jgi:cell division protein FtsZ
MSMKEKLTKRLGIDISNNQQCSSRISVGTDSNNDLQLRSNYFIDNVEN